MTAQPEPGNDWANLDPANFCPACLTLLVTQIDNVGQISRGKCPMGCGER